MQTSARREARDVLASAAFQRCPFPCHALPASPPPATGHSLGGAHATLCALDICRTLGSSLHPNHITCYTYGAPRVGNHAFAALYDKVRRDGQATVQRVPCTPEATALTSATTTQCIYIVTSPKMARFRVLGMATLLVQYAGSRATRSSRQVVHDTWNIINGNDAVPLSPK